MFSIRTPKIRSFKIAKYKGAIIVKKNSTVRFFDPTRKLKPFGSYNLNTGTTKLF